MSRTIGEQELNDIIVGAAFMGSGGGGSPKDGVRLLDELRSLNKAEVTMISHQDRRTINCASAFDNLFTSSYLHNVGLFFGIHF